MKCHCVYKYNQQEQFYYDVLKYKSNIKNYFWNDKLDEIASVSRLNSLVSIINKIEIISNASEMARCNLNLNLLIDDVVIRLGECNE